jgi:hypothetical protein
MFTPEMQQAYLAGGTVHVAQLRCCVMAQLKQVAKELVWRCSHMMLF